MESEMLLDFLGAYLVVPVFKILEEGAIGIPKWIP